jgi:DNA-binding beta-propeller fold protein YncE
MKQLVMGLLACGCGIICAAQNLPNPIMLPNGWQLSPAGKSMPLGDLPLNMAVSKSGRYIAVTNNGQGAQSIELIDTKTQQLLDSVRIARSWYGLQFSNDERFLYASAGHDNRIIKYELRSTKLVQVDSLVLAAPWPTRVGPSGLALDEARNRLYVVTRENKQLYAIDLNTKKIVAQYGLDAEAYDCKLSKDGKSLYITCWGCDKLLTFDLINNLWQTPVTVGDNPNEMLPTTDGKLMYLCNANDNSVSVIDLASKRVIETLDVALFPNAPSGSTTNSLALDAAAKRLYIANADNNCVAVFDVSVPGKSVGKGFIPVGWYPTSVRIVGNTLWVANGKGFTSKANPFGPAPTRKNDEVIHHGGSTKSAKEVQYIGSLFPGTMSMIPLPTQAQLDVYTKAVYRNTPFSAAKTTMADANAPNFPIPMSAGQKSPIKHVFYVIKENRTYDQVLSDMPGGNGDTSLLLFGKAITPNQHALAENFVLLDNFYVNAEVSADGHNWSMGGYATDYLEKTWPTSYSGRGGSYGGEGEREIANNKNGFIWNNCHRYGVSYRTYGEFVQLDKPTLPILNDHYCRNFEYNMNTRDTSRFYVWKRDFDSLLKLNKVPQFNTVRFGNDHTEGMRLGRPTPYAHVADNDLAVGLFIEALAKSPIWNETVVFILEDDAQNGADHVDAHRSPAYVAGGFVKRNFVDHTLYTSASMLRTMELILGLSPMTQYDAAATPMWRCFADAPKPFDFTAIVPNVNLADKNVAVNEWQRRSELFDFAKEDSNNDVEFNLVLWHGLKGNIPFPGPRRAAFVMAGKVED